jgi:hypothetical protein
MRSIAVAIHRADAGLAAALAAHAGHTLESLGLVKPPPTEPAVTARLFVDSVVCAAADAIEMNPRSVRPALLAAFARARELRLDVATVVDALSSAESKRKPRDAQ